ncbi:MAG: NB-ARC domain-containing protein, partial [Anaerolineales bacterium]
MAVIIFVVSLLAFPDWAYSWGLLAALGIVVVGGVVSFIANFRQAFEKPPDPPPPPPAAPQIDAENLKAGRDITIQQQIGDVIQAASQPVNFLHQLPRPPDDFTGREVELKELLDNFDKGATIFGLRGMGGIGKTALALKLAAVLTPSYPDAQFFLDLQGTSDSPLTPAAALAQVVRAYHPEGMLPESEGELRRLYLAVLHSQRALLLIDNARDAAQVLPLLPPPGCALLVTSRQRLTLPGLIPKDLNTLPPADARELLIKIAPRMAPTPGPSPVAEGYATGEGTADEIARLCGYLPLALRAAGSLLAATPDLSPARYAAQLRDERARLERIGEEGVERDVTASFNLSYARLPEAAARVFRQMAVFPGWFDALADEAVCDDEGHAHLSELVWRSLVDYDETAQRYRLHDPARLFADARLTEPERAAAQQRYAEYYWVVLNAADELFLKGGEHVGRGLALFDLEWANIQAGQAWAAANPRRNDAAARLCSAYPDAGAYVLDLRLHPREKIHWLEAALASARHMGDRSMEGMHLGNLGLAYAA